LRINEFKEEGEEKEETLKVNEPEIFQRKSPSNSHPHLLNSAKNCQVIQPQFGKEIGGNSSGLIKITFLG
jgi:hypothetical protein